jgi:hypothetical protein
MVLKFSMTSRSGTQAPGMVEMAKSGNITNNANLSFDPSKKAYGADVSGHTGDHVGQTASWNAGGANGGDPPSLHFTANGGSATSNGDQ